MARDWNFSEPPTNALSAGSNGWNVEALLVREPDNQFYSNAVAAVIKDQLVCYMPKDSAVTVGRLLGDNIFVVPAVVVDGFFSIGNSGLNLF